ncbi:MAG TPA: hypothetical protein VGR37_23880 [Longimicrobiaceae bacterium]|nr:hypothetical protein [Longimicrobiaceae bacterium]
MAETSRGSEFAAVRADFRVYSVDELGGGEAPRGRRYLVTINNDVEGYVVVGVSFKVYYCTASAKGPGDCYGPRPEGRHDGECYPGYYYEFEFFTPTDGDCAVRVEDLAISVRDIGGGHRPGRLLSKGTNECRDDFIFNLSSALRPG